jgi:hypothetical protein
MLTKINMVIKINMVKARSLGIPHPVSLAQTSVRCPLLLCNLKQNLNCGQIVVNFPLVTFAQTSRQSEYNRCNFAVSVCVCGGGGGGGMAYRKTFGSVTIFGKITPGTSCQIKLLVS